MEQVFLWSFADHSVLWMAGIEQRDHSRGVPHCAFFRLELWGLPEPDAASAVDWGAVLSYLLYLWQGPAGSGPHRCYAGGPGAICSDPVRCRSGGDRTAGTGLPGGGRRFLWPVFRLVWMGDAPAACPGYTGSVSGVCPGKRLAAGAVTALASLCLDAGTIPAVSSAIARISWAAEWKHFFGSAFEL